MRFAAIAAIVAVFGADARAEVRAELNDGFLRISPAAGLSEPTLWARGSALVVVMSKTKIRAGRRVGGLTVYQRAGRTEFEVELGRAAEEVLDKVKVVRLGDALVVSLSGQPVPTLPPPPVVDVAPKAVASAGAPSIVAPSIVVPTKPATKLPILAVPQAKAEAPKASGLAGIASSSKKTVENWMAKRKRTERSGVGSGMAVFVIVGMCALVAIWYRKRAKAKPALGTHIDVVATRALSGKHRLVMVDAGGELLLLGCTDKEVSLIRAIDRGRFERDQEASFFAAGAQMDAEADAAESSIIVDDLIGKNAGTRRDFVERLSSKLRAQPAAAASAATTGTRISAVVGDDNSPLDESWAAKIIALRRARQTAQQQPGAFH